MCSSDLDLHAGQVAGALGGLMLIALAVCSALMTDRLELIGWVLICVPLGIFRFAARALYVGAVADAGGPEFASVNFAAADTAVMLMAPVGTLLFGLTLDGGAVYLALLVSGACAIAWNGFALRAPTRFRSREVAPAFRRPPPPQALGSAERD